jgi:DNA (cytosine-5)-methyltransferase 1
VWLADVAELHQSAEGIERYGMLGTRLLGWQPIGYVEINDYCQRVIRQRILDGVIPNAPIFGDIKTFVGSGCAELYRGVTDIVTGGFPCQPFSVAGKQAGADDTRNMWPATIECIRIIRPRFALLENVPALISSGYFDTIISELNQSGYDCRWNCIPAAGFVDQRAGYRLWLLAASRSQGLQGIHWKSNGINLQSTSRNFSRDKWSTAPRVFRKGDGLVHRVERTKAIGNGQVPIVAATAWRILTGW